VPHKFKKPTAFKSWTQAVDALEAIFQTRSETDEAVTSERLEAIIFNNALHTFRLRLSRTEFEFKAAKKKKRR